MKAIITLKELERWSKIYPNMTIVQFLKIFSNKTS